MLIKENVKLKQAATKKACSICLDGERIPPLIQKKLDEARMKQERGRNALKEKQATIRKRSPTPEDDPELEARIKQLEFGRVGYT